MSDRGIDQSQTNLEHQVVFFESHFTELKYGVNGDDDLHWFVGGTSQWSTAFDPDTWYNFAYDIDVSPILSPLRSHLPTFLPRAHNCLLPLTSLTHHCSPQFGSSTVTLWASTDGDELAKVAGPVSASTSTNSADWHLGVLRIVTQNDVEDWYFSNVYVESAPITTSIAA